MSISETGDVLDFNDWIVAEFADRGAFTALVVLVEIGDRSVTPLASTYLNVIGAEVEWLEIMALFADAGVHWDGASFFPAIAPEGGPLDNAAARARLSEIESRVKAERLTLNEGFFFDRQGRRIMIEEVAAQ
ncbi:hypothetical protein [Dongia deserti]|uniref:hypothetical protein n=1 Tax=Dongia deserti TaxID=2268030 RepID=UPI002546F48D|nr:hypothetical protein [Dongia deserti]